MNAGELLSIDSVGNRVRRNTAKHPKHSGTLVKRFPEDSQPSIDYPTWWTYTVIGQDRDKLEQAIADVVAERGHKVSLSNTSSKGRYISLSLQLVVLNESERRQIFDGLRSRPGVRFVL